MPQRVLGRVLLICPRSRVNETSLAAHLSRSYYLRMSALRLPPRAAAIFCVLIFAGAQSHASDHPKKYAGLWRGETLSKGETRAEFRDGTGASRHHTIELSLGPDGSATITQSPDAVSETTTFGHWTASGDQLTLLPDPAPPLAGEPSQPPSPMSFTISHGELTPVAWDHTLWKAQGPPKLHRP